MKNVFAFIVTLFIAHSSQINPTGLIQSIVKFQNTYDYAFGDITDVEERQRLAKVFAERMENSFQEHSVMRLGRSFDRSAIFAKALDKKVVMFGDWHDSANIPQMNMAIDLLAYLVASSTRQKVFTVEFVHPIYQAELDAFISNEDSSVEEFRKTIKFDESDFGSFGWDYFKNILLTLKKYQVKSIALMKPLKATHWADLYKRDAFAVKKIREVMNSLPDAQLILFFGHLHLVGKTHLGEIISDEYEGDTIRFLSDIPALFEEGLKIASGKFAKIRGTKIESYYYYSVPFNNYGSYGLSSVVSFFVDTSASEVGKAKLTQNMESLDKSINELSKAMVENKVESIKESSATIATLLCEMSEFALKDLDDRSSLSGYEERVKMLFMEVKKKHCLM